MIGIAYILVEPSYSNSIWCKNILSGLLDEIRQKRMAYQQINNIEQVNREEEPYIFIIGSDIDWVNRTLVICNEKGIYPILLCNQAYHVFDVEYSCVCSDIIGSMRYLIDSLKAMGKSKVAMYGVNRKSISDISRMESFLSVQKNADLNQIYLNSGSLKQCYQSFIKEAEKYDAVICANDFAAISLICYLREKHQEMLEHLTIMSCAETQLSKYDTGLTSINMNFKEYGGAAISIYDCLKRNRFLSHIVMAIKWHIGAPKFAEFQRIGQMLDESMVEIPESDIFYEDLELMKMLKIEQLLNQSDEIDRIIVNGLLDEQSYEKISIECFMSESSVKYRVKKMMETCGMDSKYKLINLLREYINTVI